MQSCQEVEKSFSNQKVASSIPCRSVLGQDTEPLIAPDDQCKCTMCIHPCKSLWIKASAKLLNVNVTQDLLHKKVNQKSKRQHTKDPEQAEQKKKHKKQNFSHRQIIRRAEAEESYSSLQVKQTESFTQTFGDWEQSPF